MRVIVRSRLSMTVVQITICLYKSHDYTGLAGHLLKKDVNVVYGLIIEMHSFDFYQLSVTCF